MQEYTFKTRILKVLSGYFDDTDLEVSIEQHMRESIPKKYKDVMVTNVVINRNLEDTADFFEVTAHTKVYEFDKGEVQNADTK